VTNDTNDDVDGNGDDDRVGGDTCRSNYRRHRRRLLFHWLLSSRLQQLLEEVVVVAPLLREVELVVVVAPVHRHCLVYPDQWRNQQVPSQN
jgi:hypothetical protein